MSALAPLILEYSSHLSKLPPEFYTQNRTQSVLVGGCFDLLHYGHISFLELAQALGRPLIVALESDEAIVQRKNHPPIHPQAQRAKILASLRSVDCVLKLPLMGEYEAYLQLVQRVSPAYLAITKGDPQKHFKSQQAQQIGASLVEVIDLQEGLSSSLIRHCHL